MPYGRTPLAPRKPQTPTTPPSTLDGPQTGRDACESGYPQHVPPELRAARGLLVGFAFATILYALVAVILWLA